MTAPDALLTQARSLLDRWEQQAREALDGANDWWSEDEILRALLEAHGTYAGPDARHIAAWSPSRVLALVGVLRQLVDGYEWVLVTHREGTSAPPFISQRCRRCASAIWPCSEARCALTALGLLASLNPTGDETQ